MLFFSLLGCSGVTTPQIAPSIGFDPRGGAQTAPIDDVAPFFVDGPIRTVSLELSPTDLEFLDADPTAEVYVPGSFAIDDDSRVYPSVGVRYKGSIGAWSNCVEGSGPFVFDGARICDKLSLKVSFNRFDRDGRFHGVKKLLFHSMNNDPSLMRERLGYALFEEMGIPAPRTQWVRLEMNGSLVGLFVMIEYIDGRFTDSRFDDDDGNLYKELWPGTSSDQSIVDESRVRAHLRTNEDDPTRSVDRMLRAGQDFTEPNQDAVVRWFDVEHLAAYIAVDRAIGHDDGPRHFYCFDGVCDNHNVYVYSEGDDDHLWVIPWDLDLSFNVADDADAFGVERFIDVPFAWDDLDQRCAPQLGTIPLFSLLPPSCDSVFRSMATSFPEVVRTQTEAFVDGPYDPTRIDERLTEWSEHLRPWVEEAAAASTDPLTVDDWEDGVLQLRERIDVLRTRATQESESP